MKVAYWPGLIPRECFESVARKPESKCPSAPVLHLVLQRLTMMATLAKTMVDRSGFTVETIDDGPGFAKLKPEWEDLLESSASQCLFLTWEWLHTWWKHLAADRQLSILAVRMRE